MIYAAVSPRCRCGRVCVFRGSLGLCGRPSLALEVKGEIPDQTGPRGRLTHRGRDSSSDDFPADPKKQV